MATIYAIAPSYQEDGVQLIDVSDPSNPGEVAAVTNSASNMLNGANLVTTFTVGASTYAAVTVYLDDLVQLFNVSDPSNPVTVATVTNGGADNNMLDGASGVDTFTIGTSKYVIVTGYVDDAVNLIDVSDPSNPATVATMNDPLTLNGAFNVATFTIGASTYAIVTAFINDGVRLIDVSDPSNPGMVSAATNGVNGFTFDGPRGVGIITIGASTYAIVASSIGDGVQVIDVSDPSNPVAVAAATDEVGGFTMLNGAWDVAAFTIAARPFALVSANIDDGLQLIDLSDPSNPLPVAAATDGVNGFTRLDGVRGLNAFTIGTTTYIAAASMASGGVQMVRVDVFDYPFPPPTPPPSPPPPSPPPSPPPPGSPPV